MSERKIRVAIIGVGNCASSLVQGVEFYATSSKSPLPRLQIWRVSCKRRTQMSSCPICPLARNWRRSGLSNGDAHVGPSDYVEWLQDCKFCYIRMEGTTFGNVPLNIELKLEVWDSPNSAGVVIDAVRCAKLALDRGIGGALSSPSSYFMKTPPQQCTGDQAHERTQAFIRGDASH